MTLTSHAVFGAAVASFFPKNPVLAFILAFMSHFVLDAIPHWHYKLRSKTRLPEDPLSVDMPWNKAFFFDLLKIGADFALGCFLAYFLIIRQNGWFLSTALGAFAGMLPDALQFAYMKIRREPLISLQKFHYRIHAGKKYDDRRVIGFLIESSAVAFAFFLALIA